MRKWFLRGLAGLFGVLFVGLAGGYLWLLTSLPTLSGRIAAAGFAQPVEIIYDRNGVPHIRAQSAADAYRALGFVHARDRLFQMDFMRRLGAGRLSEVAGPPTVRIDRMMRTLGLHRLAAETLRRLPPDVRAYVEAYADGVNAFLHTRDGSLPPEFLLLRYTPEDWTPADSLVWGRIMGMRLSGNWQTEALRARLATRLSPQQIEDLWPTEDGAVPPTLAALGALRGDRRAAALFGSVLAAVTEDIRQVSASNSWAVAGHTTVTGKPILANDPHLGFSAPVLWYLARLSAPGLEVTGATAPGVPFHVLGHNGRIAWAFTTTDSDTQDLFVERLAGPNADRYETPSGPRAFATRTEIIRVRGRPPVRLTVRETRHGPVVSGLDPRFAGLLPKDRIVALAAAALRPDDLSPLALRRIGVATDWPSFREALRDFHAPQQNITYADVDGNTGFIAPARVPVRRAGDGRIPVPGWDGAHDWSGFVPFEELPQAFNPASGRIVNANHAIVPPSYRWLLTRDWSPAYRARRIHQMLDAAPRHSVETSERMQTDELSLAARDLLPRMLAQTSASGARAARAVALLRGWDGVMRRDAVAPLLFAAWLRMLNRGVLADELGELFADNWRLRPRFIRSVLDGKTAWCDDVTTAARETCPQILGAALDAALADLADRFGDDMDGWRWGAAHEAHFRHPVLGWVPVLRRLGDIRIESGGGPFTVNRAQNYVGRERSPFTSVHGPGYRAVYDLSDLANSRFAIATGQSGNPLSDRFADATVGWRNGAYIRIPQTREAALEGARGVLVLTPP